MSALTVNLAVDQNADFEATFVVTDEDTGAPMNLTNYTASAALKKSFYSSSSTSFTANIIDATRGKVKISLNKTQTATLKGGRYVYDLIITNTNSSITTRVVEGIVTVKEGVT